MYRGLESVCVEDHKICIEDYRVCVKDCGGLLEFVYSTIQANAKREMATFGPNIFLHVSLFWALHGKKFGLGPPWKEI